MVKVIGKTPAPKTCPAGQHLENGVCVPDEPKKEEPIKEPRPPRPGVRAEQPARFPGPKKFYVSGEGYVSEERYKNVQEEARFIAAGGRKAITPEERAVQEQEKVVQEKVLEERGFFEEKPPERVELDISKEEKEREIPLEKFPVIGPSISVLGKLTSELLGVQPEDQALIQEPETLREMALQEIQKEVIKEGTSSAEKFGAFVESIPVIGGLVSKYASGLIETPSGNAATILGNILNEKERALNTAEMVRSGRLDQLTALDRLQGIEENIARLEQRLQLLANESPILKADADTLNKFETEILRTRERVEDARTSAFGQIIKEPTDTNIFLTLRELKRKK